MSVSLYGEALLSPEEDVLVRGENGDVRVLPAWRWIAPVDEVDRRVTMRVDGPTLDIGCGPGRLVTAVATRGIPVLGIDIAPTAVTMTRQRGGSALTLDVFGRVPGAGRWRWALLLDGNIGIGGSPARLLRRTRELLTPGGSVVLEVEPPGSRCLTQRIRLETSRRAGGWFPWAWLSADCVEEAGDASHLELADLWQDQGRWFAELRRS